MRILPLTLIVLAACRDAKDPVDTGADTVVAAVDADSDGYTEDEDCDDSDGNANPGAAEICDGIDNNCDGTVDEGVTEIFYADADADGFGDPAEVLDACDAPAGYVEVPNDCDDSDPTSYPSAAERCDGADNDCDGTIDEDVESVWYADADEDGYGGDTTLEDCDPPDGYVANTDDCDDLDEDAYPGAEEVCDEADNDCDTEIDEGVTDTFYQDQDADGYGTADDTTEGCSQPTGYATRAGDCDDTDGAISPNAAELCDGVDNDCDSVADEDDAADAATWYADSDGDGYGSTTTSVACDEPSGYTDNDDDCDDSDGGTNPGAAEVCDEADNDCDGETDEDSATDAATWYADGDGDGYGSTVSTVSCEQPSGYADNDDDCDDASGDAYPGASEVCDEADNDCDGSTDEDVTTTYYQDSDGDGQGDAASTTDACDAPSGYVSTAADCDDTDAAISPNATEVCDEVDNDCDGETDEDDAADAATWYADGDGDGYGSTTASVACEQPSGYADNNDDCDDSDGGTSPDAEEVCDEVDNDCDGETDEGAADPTTWYLDADGDGYGTPDDALTTCDEPTGYTDNDEDCDDDEPTANPDAEEIADGIDNDCDGAGLNGSYTASSSASLAGGTYEYTTFTIGASATLTVTGGSTLTVYVLGDVDISGDIDLSGEDGEDIGPFAYSRNAGGDGGGGGGGDGGDGSSYYVDGYPYGAAQDGSGDAPGDGGIGYSAGSGGGGGGQIDAGDDGEDSGGCYSVLAGGTAGSSVNSTSTPELIAGSGGGGGGYGTGYNSDGAGGGGGGGAFFLQGADVDISGDIDCYGGDGGGNSSGSNYHAAGGGGGSGGTFWIVSDSLDISGRIDCDGGRGGNAYYGTHCGIAGDGGDGADGLIYLDTDSISVTGSVTPSYTVP